MKRIRQQMRRKRMMGRPTVVPAFTTSSNGEKKASAHVLIRQYTETVDNSGADK